MSLTGKASNFVLWHKALLAISVQEHSKNMQAWAPQYTDPVSELLCCSDHLHQNETGGI